MSAAHPMFTALLDECFPLIPDTHRGWSISFDYPPIPCRNFDWSATSPDYDASYEGAEDGWVSSGAIVHGSTREAIIQAIDAHLEENG